LERFDLKNLNDAEVKKKYQVEISNRFATLESSDGCFDFNNSWESIRENIKTSVKDNLGYHRLKHSKPCFDDECSKLIDNGSRLNYSGCKIQAKSVEIICRI
jgi:hypothetical protein